MDFDYCDFDKVTDPEIRKVVLAHRNSRTPDPSPEVDGNLYSRRMSYDFRAEQHTFEGGSSASESKDEGSTTK
ncbi:hypothetical protein BIW11_09728 [Tropilaelaps mercedesae]|uniref:Uncharacterized protein n=1 Tax=Tropilaelaps mercedesae TaxID=418985 RepID=A0A1V9XIT1_9ACAR|nr:hypothetical protein BIW11_09728 [Tropilaelaps mercedesae]